MSRFKRRILPTGFSTLRLRSGFTIVELLIVIVIIGILSTLVIVSYTGISDLARKTTLSSNAQSVLRSIKVYLVDHEDFDPLTLDETNVKSTLNLDTTGYETLAMYNQSGENYIYIVGKDNFTGLVACGIQGSVNVYAADEAACAFGGSAYAVLPVTGDEPGVLGGGNGSTCALAKTIGSIEDLVYLSNSVNSGTTYSGICIKLTTDLDFEQSKSYVDKSTTAFGDINGNSIVEGLKTELTTGAGFVPIGNNNAAFNGTFTGDKFTIYNLLINRPTSDYVGFMGAGNGTITGLKLTNVDIVGNNYVGGAVGSGGTLTDTTISGNVTGGNNVGLAMGYTGLVKSVITSGDVTGNSCVGGLVGGSYIDTITGVYNGGNIVGNDSVGRIFGCSYYWNYGMGHHAGYALSSATVNGSTIVNNDIISPNGATISSFSEVTDDINTADAVFDTYIGGDENNDGYYWDYDIGGDLVEKNTTTEPLTFSLAGSGTTGDPFLIANYTDLKQATLKLDKVYKLTANINLSGQKFYILGGYNHSFTGTFYGNNKTISNLSLDIPAASYVGFMGINGGTLTDLNLANVDIVGGNYVGAAVGTGGTSTGLKLTNVDIVGNNYVGGAVGSGGTLTDTTISGNVTGGNNVGLAMGYTGLVKSVITSGDVTGNSCVGGLVGGSYIDTITGVYNGGNIVGNDSVGRIFGCSYYWNYGMGHHAGYALSSATVNGSTIVNNDIISPNGKDATSGMLSLQPAYTDVEFNFADETLDYIWYMDAGVPKFREGNL